MGELIFGHHVHAIDSQHEEDADDEQRYRVMIQWPFQPIHLILHNS